MRCPTAARVGVYVLLASCSTPQAATLQVIHDGEVVRSDGPHKLAVRVIDTAGGEVQAPTVSFLSSAPEIVAVDQDGQYRCLRSGRGTLLVAANALAQSVQVECAVVQSVRAPKWLQLLVGEAPRAVEVSPLDSDGRPLTDAPWDLTSSDPTVVSVIGETITGLSGGRVVLTARSGAATAETVVVVVDVGSIEMPGQFLVAVGDGGTVAARALDHSGHPLQVFPDLVVADPVRAAAGGPYVSGRAFGITELVAKAGRTERRAQLLVFEEGAPQPFQLNPGEPVAFEVVGPGFFEVQVKAKAANGNPRGVQVRWEGVACAGSPEAASLMLACEVRDSARLVVINPTDEWFGTMESGFVVVNRFPIGAADRKGAVRLVGGSDEME